jgi:outer membrane protein assembly factor BamB
LDRIVRFEGLQVVAWLALLAAAVGGGCPGPGPRLTGCAKDVDCKGSRVCELGRCVEPFGWSGGPDGGVGLAAEGDAGKPRPIGPPPFAMGRGNARHTGALPGVAPAKQPVEVWKVTAGDAIVAAPVVGPDGAIYFGSHDGKLTAVEPDGKVRWTFAAKDRIWSAPAVAVDGTVYFGCDDDHVYAVAKDGKEKWRFRVGACNPAQSTDPESVRCDVDGLTLGADGTIYTGGDGVYAVWPDGSLRWKVATPEHVRSAPAVADDGTVYAGSLDDALYAIGPDGTKRWEFRINDDIETSPTIGDDGTIYFGADDHRLYAIAPDGAFKWAIVTLGDVRSSPAIGLDGTIYAGSWDKALYAVRPDGTVLWRFATADKIQGAPVVSRDGAILVGSQDDHLYVLEPDGTLRWYVTLDADVDASPTIGADGTLYVGGDDRTLRAFR